jgi:hypothetical protein
MHKKGLSLADKPLRAFMNKMYVINTYSYIPNLNQLSFLNIEDVILHVFKIK